MTSKSNVPLFPQQAFFALALLALLAPASTARGATVSGEASESWTDWLDPQGGERCDYVLMTGARASITPTKVNGVPKNARVVFRDRDGDLVVVSLKGAGSITVDIEDVTAAADSPNHFSHPCVSGHASLTLFLADATTSLSIYSVGSTNGNYIARPKPGASYQGIADIKRLTIIAEKSMIGTLSLANVRFSGTQGVVGISTGTIGDNPIALEPASVSIYDIKASETAMPGLIFGSGTEVAVCGGDLSQPNGRTLQTREGTTLRFREGSTADGIKLPAIPYTPSVAAHPQSLAVTPGQGSTFSATATGTLGTAAYQWQFNGGDVAGATTATHPVASASSATAGLYAARVTDAGGRTTTQAAILGLTIPGKLAGAAEEVGSNITHQNGRTFDQMLLQGTSASLRADAGQITRMSFIDLTDDIVQIEFSGAGTLTVTLEPGSTGPAAPANYNQAVSYLRGHARIVVAGADETTNLSVFSVGRLTAWDPTGAFNFLQPSSPTNDPAKNGSPLFKSTVTYDGFADLASISILSANGKFGGLRTSNANYYATSGLTGVYAPGVMFTGPVFVGDINAADAAEPVLRVGSATDVRITGGDLAQLNQRAVSVSGFARLRFSAGQNSHGVLLAPQTNLATLTPTDRISVEIVKDGT